MKETQHPLQLFIKWDMCPLSQNNHRILEDSAQMKTAAWPRGKGYQEPNGHRQLFLTKFWGNHEIWFGVYKMTHSKFWVNGKLAHVEDSVLVQYMLLPRHHGWSKKWIWNVLLCLKARQRGQDKSYHMFDKVWKHSQGLPTWYGSEAVWTTGTILELFLFWHLEEGNSFLRWKWKGNWSWALR